MPKTARLFCISGPSGAGKGTLVGKLLQVRPDLALSVSATTRKPRPGEKEGIHYYYLSDSEFDKLVQENGFLEWANVHQHRYGTLRSVVEKLLNTGNSVILEIDPQGAFQVKKAFNDVVLIFIEPPSLAELERRLRRRGTETEEAIHKRLSDAEVELKTASEYDAIIVNDNLDRSLNELFTTIEDFEKEM